MFELLESIQYPTWIGEITPLNQLDTVDIATVDIATEESVKKLGGTVGWGAVGAVILGLVGLLAGVLLGWEEKRSYFCCKI